MRHESLYLNDIVEAADDIAEFIAGIDFQGFQKSELLRSAVVQKLEVIGEAAARVSDEFTSRHPEVPWPQIVALPQYSDSCIFGVDWEVVWLAATDRRPVLRGQIAVIPAAEFGGLDKAE